jgi:hypothetical protein
MAAVDGARSANMGHDVSSRDNLAASTGRTPSKGSVSSAVSIASSDQRDDDMHRSSDGALDKLRSRNSDDGRSDTSTAQRKRMSRIFKGRSKRTKSATSQEDGSQADVADDIPPVPRARRPSPDARNHSDDSLGLHRSVASSLLTEDSDSDA